MEAGFRLQDSKIAIIGLGLMGGSLAMALKGKCAALYGIDSHHPTLELALSKNIVDHADTDPANFLPHVDLIVLALPIPALMDFLQILPSLTQNPGIVLDLGSTKREIVQAMSTLPDRFDPIGGHPICGKEKLGLQNADLNLYKNTPFAVTALERTTQKAKSAAKQIISAIGSQLIEISAEYHDCVFATTSHLPFLLATSLTGSTSPEYSPFIGPGFRSASRLAGTPSHIMMGILKSNRDNVLHAIHTFRNKLDEVQSALQNENYTELENLLNQSRSNYLALVET